MKVRVKFNFRKLNFENNKYRDNIKNIISKFVLKEKKKQVILILFFKKKSPCTMGWREYYFFRSKLIILFYINIYILSQICWQKKYIINLLIVF